MQKLSKKQLLKHRVQVIMVDILKSLVSPEEGRGITLHDAKKQFKRSSTFKDHETGEIRTGLSWKGVRQLVKKYPYVNAEAVKVYFGLS